MYLPFSAIIIYCGKFIAGFTTAFTIKNGGKIIKYIDLVNKTIAFKGIKEINLCTIPHKRKTKKLISFTVFNSFQLLNKKSNNK